MPKPSSRPLLSANTKKRQGAPHSTRPGTGQADLDHLARMAEQVQQLSAQLAQRDRQLKALHEIGQALSATLDIREICLLIYHEIARQMLGAAHMLIALYDAAAQNLICGFAIS